MLIHIWLGFRHIRYCLFFLPLLPNIILLHLCFDLYKTCISFHYISTIYWPSISLTDWAAASTGTHCHWWSDGENPLQTLSLGPCMPCCDVHRRWGLHHNTAMLLMAVWPLCPSLQMLLLSRWFWILLLPFAASTILIHFACKFDIGTSTLSLKWFFFLLKAKRRSMAKPCTLGMILQLNEEPFMNTIYGYILKDNHISI